MDNAERAIETARSRGQATLLDNPGSPSWRQFQRAAERRARFGRRWFTALAVALFLQGCASVEPSDIHEQHLSGIRAATIPRCYQGVSARGYCREGTGRVVQLGLATMIDVGSE